jgi:hypothetical protein
MSYLSICATLWCFADMSGPGPVRIPIRNDTGRPLDIVLKPQDVQPSIGPLEFGAGERRLVTVSKEGAYVLIVKEVSGVEHYVAVFDFHRIAELHPRYELSLHNALHRVFEKAQVWLCQEGRYAWVDVGRNALALVAEWVPASDPTRYYVSIPVCHKRRLGRRCR